MCDSFVATPEFTGTGNLIIAKNSDREPNEAHQIVRVPRAEHSEKTLRATFIEIPQVKETFELLLSKPFQMWGAEMGSNEHGVTIVNEAVFTRVPFQKKGQGLTGMDLIRLALERTRSAQAALDLIISLLEEHGQDVCGGYQNQKFFYHNGFIIADPREAFALQTAGKHWVAKKVKGFYAMSNGLSIESDFDFASKDVVTFAEKNGWHRPGTQFNFRKSYSDWFYTKMGRCALRREAVTRNGEKLTRKLDVSSAIQMLQDHAGQSASEFKPELSNTGYVCMHSTGITNPSQTTGAMISELRPGGTSTHWMTGTAASCISLFKPFFIPGSTLNPNEFPAPGAKADGSLWWRHEKLHRTLLGDYPNRAPAYRIELEKVQSLLIEREHSLRQKLASSNVSTAELDEFSRAAVLEGDRILASALGSAQENASPTRSKSWFYRWHWNRANQAVGI